MPVLTLDEWDTIRKVLHDWGMIDTYYEADYEKVKMLKIKFNLED